MMTPKEFRHAIIQQNPRLHTCYLDLHVEDKLRLDYQIRVLTLDGYLNLTLEDELWDLTAARDALCDISTELSKCGIRVIRRWRDWLEYVELKQKTKPEDEKILPASQPQTKEQVLRQRAAALASELLKISTRHHELVFIEGKLEYKLLEELCAAAEVPMVAYKEQPMLGLVRVVVAAGGGNNAHLFPIKLKLSAAEALSGMARKLATSIARQNDLPQPYVIFEGSQGPENLFELFDWDTGVDMVTSEWFQKHQKPV